MVLNGKTTMIVVARATIQPKNISGRNVPIISNLANPRIPPAAC